MYRIMLIVDFQKNKMHEITKTESTPATVKYQIVLSLAKKNEQVGYKITSFDPTKTSIPKINEDRINGTII